MKRRKPQYQTGMANPNSVWLKTEKPFSLVATCYISRSRLARSTADLTPILSKTRARCTSTVRTLILELVGHQLVGQSAHHQPHHIALALGQAIEPRLQAR